MEIVSQISQWIQENRGIFTFGTHTPMDESIFNSLSEFLLKQADSYSTKNAVSDVSYLKSFSLKDSVFVFRSRDIISGGNYEQDKQILKTIADNCIDKNNIVLLQVPVYQTSDGNHFVMKNGGSGIMVLSNFASVLSNGKLSIQKLRWGNSDDYKDVDILQFVRDYKLDLLI
jgi:hypothetical protein